MSYILSLIMTRCISLWQRRISGFAVGEAVQIIGNLESCYKDRFGVPRQSGLVAHASAKLRIKPEFQPEDSLEGLNQFSHLWLIFLFHENSNARFHSKVHPPRLGGKSIGVFATRSPHHPNPIGLSLVKLEKVDGDTLWLSGVDLLDGTPVLDVKPYLPEIEAVPTARSGWTETVGDGGLALKVTDEQRSELLRWQRRLEREGQAPANGEPAWLEQLIRETIALDPRPLLYKEKDLESPRRHAFRLFDGDVHFRVTAPGEAAIEKLIERLPPG